MSKVYDFIWDEFCDWYIELAKYRIYHAEEDPKGANDALWTLREVLKRLSEITASIYAIRNRRDLRQTDSGRGVTDDVCMAGI